MKITAEVEAATILLSDFAYVPSCYRIPNVGEFYSIVGNSNVRLCRSKNYSTQRVIYVKKVL